ncbi:UDP-N-acetylglucosamine--dolichyl-phosphate N-acetylglucosaminephosphotransferase-like [Histomonas meleagridis]|uniref:UDP-N-acetylglucosamine--dolichyl-phosphate N-acetylglucosaminephosphotransferase-like n=1 Tax=Histomonas meleagridis TaxID=135588 RepID=UPI003559EB98|nr:UDP-N-acetylglucosamine--dolichyl-phosphate N-acetylglucosaminephosphotransferase-like [Histomonas meleagridis]KAH0799054.1 UDP-N-acetylglucosamine--dolichyl-phosphate N-acetylglucosaminephosphotransferase-like [Histomonas meleagridis]
MITYFDNFTFLNPLTKGMPSASYWALLLYLIPVAITCIINNSFSWNLAIIIIISIIGYFALLIFIPKCIPSHIHAQLSGIDINKQGSIRIPESMGLETSFILILLLVGIASFSESKDALYPGIIAIIITTLLGFADDVLNIPWRVKIVIPFISCLPIILGYSGSTTICLHGFLSPLKSLFKFDCIDIGPLYLVYIICLFVFCTHSINIYAGINGLEAGQSFVVGCFLLFHCISYWSYDENSRAAACLLIPFLATTFALLYFNWYPSRVFVGDTFTLTAGSVIAAAGIIGHFAEMTLLFMLPQLINFVFSLPQLIGIIKCGRHRLPKLNEKSLKLEGRKENLNVVNYWLILFGPKTEKRLCLELVIFQGVCCILAYVVKYLYNRTMAP